MHYLFYGFCYRGYRLVRWLHLWCICSNNESFVLKFIWDNIERILIRLRKSLYICDSFEFLYPH